MFAGGWLVTQLFKEEGVPVIYKVILVETALAVMINVVLNFYWSFLIIKQLYRIIKGGSKANNSAFCNEVGSVEDNNLDKISEEKRSAQEKKKILFGQFLCV